MLAWGFDPDDFVRLSPRRLCAGCNGTTGCSVHAPLCRNPSGQVGQGLASVLRALGVQIVEGARVLDVGANAIETDRGAVRFQTLIRATEATPNQ